MVKKESIIFIVIMAYLFINMFVSSCLGMSNNEYIAYAIDYNNDIIKNDNYELGIDSNYVLNSNQVDVQVILNSDYNIKDYLVEDTDFLIIEGKKKEANKLLFTLECPSYDYYELNVIVKLTNNNILYVHIYAICNDFGVFISKESFDNALDNIIDYFLSNNIITMEEIDKIREEYLYKKELGNQSDYLEENIINKQKIANTNPRSGDTQASGTLTWKDNNGNEYALRKVKVELRDSDLIGSQLLGTTYTDNSGYYSISFTNDSSILENGGCDLFIRVFAGDDNAYVVESDGVSKYSVDTSHTAYQNVSTGSNTEIKVCFEMTSNSKKALQISQALLTARDFAKAMKGTNPHSVVVRYPYGTKKCYYNHNTDMITICEDYRENVNVPWNYASWDAIMHEYGHHIAYYEGIDASPGGWHSPNVNIVDHYLSNDNDICKNECAAHRSDNPINNNCAKEEGLKLTWGEGWATAFAFIAQNYTQENYSSEISSVPGVCNEMYDSYNQSSSLDYRSFAHDLYAADEVEISIYTVLWDLFDTNNDSHDRLSLSYQEWWSITTGYHAYTFSDFMEDFYNRYPKHIGDIGYNLEYYNIAPTLLINESNIVEIQPNMTTFNFNYYFNQTNTINYKFDNFYVTIFSKDYLESYTSPLLELTNFTISSSIFDNIKTFKNDKVHIAFKAVQSGISPYYGGNPQAITSGPYYSHCITVPKRCFKTIITNNQVTITDTYCVLSDIINIPATIDGYSVTAIGNNALYGQDEIVAVTFENYLDITSIGSNAFKECSSLVLIRVPDNVIEINYGTFSECGALKWTYMGNSLVTINPFAFYSTNLSSMDTIPSTIQIIGEQAFCNCSLSSSFYLPANSQLTSIGNYAFCVNSNLSSLVIKNTITSIGDNAFRECDNLTIYTNATSKLTGWSSSWNYSNRPVFWGCTLDSTNSYVVSFTKSNSNPANRTATNGINNPYRDGYNFGGWYTTSDYSGTQYTNVLEAPNGTLYAKWVKKSCVAEGSLITLADGTQVAVEDLTGDEYLLVWNMLTGQFDVAPILFIDNDPTLTYEIIELTFSDGTIVKVIDEHAFFDMTLGEYVFLRSDAYQYIGHYFNKQSYDNNNNMIWTSVQLTNVTIYNEITTAWSPVTYSYLCYYVNGMLSMPGATEGFINIFEVDTTNMQYDATLMASDIATYGLYTYEEFNAIIPIPELVFNAFNGQYLKVSIGKGLITLNQIALLLERYSIFFV